MDVPGIERLAIGQFVIHLHRAGLDVDDHQPGRQAVQDKHDLVQADGLAGVDFRVIGAGAVVAIVTPHHLLVRRDFGDVLHPRKEDVAVGKHPQVVVFEALAGLVGPNHLAVVDEEHFVVTLADIEHRVLCQPLAGQAGARGRVRPFAGWRLGFGGSHRRHSRGGEVMELNHARRS